MAVGFNSSWLLNISDLVQIYVYGCRWGAVLFACDLNRAFMPLHRHPWLFSISTRLDFPSADENLTQSGQHPSCGYESLRPLLYAVSLLHIMSKGRGCSSVPLILLINVAVG